MTSGKKLNQQDPPPMQSTFTEPVEDDQPKICQYTGQVIVEKNRKFLGLSFMTMIAVVIMSLIAMIALVFLLVPDKKVRKQVLLQGIIVILCGISYGVYLTNYEKSKKLHLKTAGMSSANTSDVQKSDLSSASENEINKKNK